MIGSITMNIIDMHPDDNLMQQAAALLVEGFKAHWPNAWPTLEDALQEVREALEPGKIARAAIGDNGAVLGWIGGISQYDGRVWELHPLVVHPAYQGQGIGRALALDLEAQVRRRGGVTLLLGTDDEDNMTSLGGKNLYPNVLARAANIQNLHRHPFEFYQKLGFVIVGVIPDANGPGKPDILMAKRVG